MEAIRSVPVDGRNVAKPTPRESLDDHAVFYQEATRTHGAGGFMTRAIAGDSATVRVCDRWEAHQGHTPYLLFNTEAQAHRRSNVGVPRAGTGLAR